LAIDALSRNRAETMIIVRVGRLARPTGCRRLQKFKSIRVLPHVRLNVPTAASRDLNPRVRPSGLGLSQHDRISKVGRSHARAMLVEAAWPKPMMFVSLLIRRICRDFGGRKRSYAFFANAGGLKAPD
jgi:hypothetical protein